MLSWAERVKHRFIVGEDLRGDRTVARIMSGNSSYGRGAVSMALAWHGVPVYVTAWLLTEPLTVKRWQVTWRKFLWRGVKLKLNRLVFW